VLQRGEGEDREGGRWKRRVKRKDVTDIFTSGYFTGKQPPKNGGRKGETEGGKLNDVSRFYHRDRHYQKPWA